MLPTSTRKKGPPSGLRIDTPTQNATITLVPGYSSASTSAVSPTTSESGSFQFPPPPKSRSRNMKKLSLTLSTQSSSSSLAIPPSDFQLDHAAQEARSRRTSTVSASSMLLRKEEDGSPTAPYLDGPIEILPKIWLGAEDNARDWRGLVTRGIGSVLNVAKEVVSPFDTLTAAEAPQAQRANELPGGAVVNPTTYYPADGLGRPGLHYLKLLWSHGQSDLVQRGFPEAMAFVDQSLARGEGVLIQCVSFDLLSWIRIHTWNVSLAVNVVFPDPPPWSSPSLCALPLSVHLGFPNKSGISKECMPLMHM
jgi:tyrosine-protein phosphatase